MKAKRRRLSLFRSDKTQSQNGTYPPRWKNILCEHEIVSESFKNLKVLKSFNNLKVLNAKQASNYFYWVS